MERLSCLRAGLFLVCSWGSVAVCTWLALTSAVHAEEAAEPAGYRELVEQALHEYAAGNQEESRSLFSRAHALFPNARTHRGIAMAEFELRNYQACIVQLEAALGSSVRPLADKLRADSEALLQRARNFVGSVLLDTRPQASELRVDGLPAELTPGRPLVLRVGDHWLEASAPGLRARETSARRPGR